MSEAVTPLEQQQLRVTGLEHRTFWHRVRFDLVVRQARRDGARAVLDIGAGSGLLGDHLVAEAPDLRYRAQESSEVLRRALAERFGGDAVASDAHPIETDTVVALLDVVEHVEDDLGFVRGIAERMAPGASLVVTVPASPWLFSSWDVALGHHRRYRRTELAALVRRAGLRVEESGLLFPELWPVAAARRFGPQSTEAADFPQLPRWVDAVAYTVGSLTARLRRWWPWGTSVVVVARRVGGST